MKYKFKSHAFKHTYSNGEVLDSTEAGIARIVPAKYAAPSIGSLLIEPWLASINQHNKFVRLRTR